MAAVTCLALLICLAYVIMLECALRQTDDNALDLPAHVRRPHSRGSGPAVKVRLRNLLNLRDYEAQLRGLLNLTDLEAQLRVLLNLGADKARSCCARKVKELISMTSGLDIRKSH